MSDQLERLAQAARLAETDALTRAGQRQLARGVLALLSERRELVELVADIKFYLSRQYIFFSKGETASMWSQCNPGLQERVDAAVALAARIAPNQDGEK